MGASESDRSALSEQVVTTEEIRRELSTIERIRQQFSGQDEFMEALLEGQKLQLMQMEQTGRLLEEFAGYGDVGEISIGRVGKALEEIPLGQSGEAVFSFGGSPRKVMVRADQSIKPTDTIEIVGEGNLAELTSRDSLLGDDSGDDSDDSGTQPYVKSPDGSNTANYFSTGESSETITSASKFTRFDFGRIANVINLRFDQSIELALADPAGDEGNIMPLESTESPFTIGSDSGISTAFIWIRKADSSTADPNIDIIAFK